MKRNFIGGFAPAHFGVNSSLIFEYTSRHHLVKDRISGTAWSQTYAGTNRTRITSAGLIEAVATNTPVIDHVGVSLVPALRLEPAAANILLEVLTDWTDTTLTPVKNATSWAGAANGAYTVTASGANGTLISTAVSATSAAFTFVCAIKRKTGTGAVSMTIDNGSTWTEKTLTTSFQYFNVTKTAANPQLGFKLATSGDAIIVDCLMLVPNTAIASSYFAPAAAIGAELVTDGGFDAVEVTGLDLAPADTCTSVTGEVDATTGWTNAGMNTFASDTKGDEPTGTHSLHLIAADENDNVYLTTPIATVIGLTYKIVIQYIVPNDDADTTLNFRFGTTRQGYDYFNVASDNSQVWTTLTKYITATATELHLSFYEGGTGNDVEAYIDTVSVKNLIFSNWTCDTGWAPQATAGALTGKAQKIAGTASDLVQATAAAEANKVYRVGNTAVRTAGTLTPEFGSTDGAVISANGTYYDYPIAADTDYLKFKADAAFAGSVDVATVKEHGTVRLSEANTVTLVMAGIPKVAAMLAAGTGTIVIKGRFAFARAAGVVTAILSSQDATASLAYTTTAAGNLTTYDGTTIAESTGAYTANVDWKIAITFPSDTDKYRIGVDADGAGIVQGTEVAFDGNFTTTANLILGYVLHGATWIKYIKILNKVLTDAQINAMS